MRPEYEQQEQVISRRGMVMLAGGIVGLGALATRLFQLQISQSDYYRAKAERNRTDLEVLLPKRGAILDERGENLAASIVEYDLYLQEKIGTLSAEKLENILSYLNLETPALSALQDLILTSNQRPLLIKRNMPYEQLMRLEFHRATLPRFRVHQQIRRHYFSKAFSPVTGYIGRANKHDQLLRPHALMEEYRLGKAGIERRYEQFLHGKSGSASIEVDVYGRHVQELERIKSQAGADVQLHINADLQNAVMERLAMHRSAAVVVLDAHSGAIKALASYPFYDANEFKAGLSAERWRELINNPQKPMVNKAISGLYAPGSTFKPIVALAAMRAGIDTREEHVCHGFISLGSTRFHCWKKNGHGRVDLIQAIAQSCDVWFYQIARKIGIEKIAAMAREVGLGTLSHIDLNGEKAGIVPDTAWKRQTFNEPFYPGEVVNHGIGQGYLLCTPLQLACAYASFINGGYVLSPQVAHRVLRSGRSFQTKSPMSRYKLTILQAHLAVVRNALGQAVNQRRGTAWHSRLAPEMGFAMAGKTGTTQVRRISRAEREQGIRRDNIDWNLRDHALFVGFAPLAQPRYVITVLVEHGVSGARSAAPIAKDVFSKMYHIGMIPSHTFENHRT